MPSELVEPVVQLFTRYGKNPPVVEEPGGFNPDEDEAPSPGVVQVRHLFSRSTGGSAGDRPDWKWGSGFYP